MKTSQKIVLGIGVLLLLGIVGWFFYRRRWREFDDNGNTQWLSGGGSGKLALQMKDDKHGIKKGDKIEVESSASGMRTGEMTVTDVFTDKGFSWVGTNKNAIPSGDRTPGKVRVIS
jgi:hypothetical protein